MGCLVAVGIVVILMIVAGVWLYFNFRTLAAEIGRTTMTEFVKTLELPSDQKQGVIDQVDRLTEMIKNKEVNVEEIGRIVQTITEGPVVAVGMMLLAEEQVIDPSSLTDEQKQQGRLDLQRLARGIVEGAIPPGVIEDVAQPIATTGPDGKQTLKEQPTDEEVREFLAAARAEADAAEIPNEPFTVDLAEEVRRAIDSVVGDRGTNTE
ncbi:MAG: hypothetical protein CMJ18_19540 [Phycisphaeraceae bacterium]|nr:hypothetical protein [Phycisphaeraceae bacterium]